MLNDTLDDFTIGNITSKWREDPKEDPPRREISFDDSMFLNLSLNISILRDKTPEIELKENNITDDDIFNESDTNAKESSKNNLSVLHLSEVDTNVNKTISKMEKFKLKQCPPVLRPYLKSKSNAERIPLELSSLKNLPLKETSISRNLNSKSNPFNDKSSLQQNLSAWGLPPEVLEKYEARGVTTMFPWQVKCLNNPKVLKEHRNLLYSAPTSAGKTLVAEILSIKTILERHKKVIFVLPFVSVVREKMFYFQEIFGGTGVRVEGFMGSYHPPGGIKAVQLAVCTIEKANSLINSFLREGNLGDIGGVVIDELHLLGESHRGYLLELLLTKIRYMTLKNNLTIQIIGMSATLPNLEILANWLDASLYVTDFRPIPLFEHTHIDGAVYDKNLALIRNMNPMKDLGTDTDNILQLCLETIKASCSVLIFCPTKNWCESLATQISTAFNRICGDETNELRNILVSQFKTDLLLEVVEQLKFCPAGLDDVLRRTVGAAVAYHHAGLTMDERDIIEGAFRNGVIKVLIATSTLSSGVNLPAKRVIIRTPIFHGKPLDSLTYRQMVGRAGRMGRDSSGESLLICQKKDASIAKKLIVEPLQPIESCLGGKQLHRGVLEVIASGVVNTLEDVEVFINCTLLSQEGNLANTIEDVLEFLTTNEFIVLQAGGKCIGSSLGRACLSSSITPEEGLALFAELEKARQCFVLETELHLIYLVTPYSACHQWATIDWMFYLELFDKLPASMKKVGELVSMSTEVGVKESYLVSATRGKPQNTSAKQYEQLLIHKRFFIALALQDLVNETPLGDVCQKFDCNKGLLQSLQLTASTFAGMVTAFSKQLGWSSVELLIGQFQDRLQFGVSRDLLDLMRLPVMNGKTARALYNAGMESLIDLANSDVSIIENILLKLAPFQSGKLREGETEYQLQKRNKFKNIWITGKDGLTEHEAAEILLNGSRNYLQLEMGLKEAQWETKEKSLSGVSDSSLFENSIIELNRHSLNSTSDFIGTSQDESLTPSAKKRTRKSIIDEGTPKKKLKCALFPQIEIIEIDEGIFATFCKEFNLQNNISFSVGFINSYQRTKTIGLTPQVDTYQKLVYKSKKLEGFAFFWGQNLYYANVTKLTGIENIVKQAFENSNLTIKLFNTKEQLKLLKNIYNWEIQAKFEDPKIAAWLLEPESREKSLQGLVHNYCPTLPYTTKLTGSNLKIQTSIQAFANWHLSNYLKEELVKQDIRLVEVFEIEMLCQNLLCQMELSGISINKATLQNILQTLTIEQKKIERQAYHKAGRRFTFSSINDIAKLLRVPKTQTKKQFLKKNDNPLAKYIINWRKINSAATKIVQPLLKCVKNGRIHGCSITHTATGRITMHEPNIQNVAKNFAIESVQVCCRNAFQAPEGWSLVSADYCQLELRLLTHLSQDGKLCKIMRGKGDVFRMVAAQWNKIPEQEVTEELRQNAKGLCYGIIYGMGSKALGEQLNIAEEEAKELMSSFKTTYPGVQDYIKKVVAICRDKGYSETISGRRRYLPQIFERNALLKSQAERQAINTTIQGSAADLVKRTMIIIDKKCPFRSDQVNLVLHLHDELLYEVTTENTENFALFLRQTMEESINLSIPFPVKVKSGPSWGELTEL